MNFGDERLVAESSICAYNSRGEVTRRPHGSADFQLVVSNRYDHLGRRVQKITPEATHTYFYDGWLLVKEVVERSGDTRRCGVPPRRHGGAGSSTSLGEVLSWTQCPDLELHGAEEPGGAEVAVRTAGLQRRRRRRLALRRAAARAPWTNRRR